MTALRTFFIFLLALAFGSTYGQDVEKDRQAACKKLTDHYLSDPRDLSGDSFRNVYSCIRYFADSLKAEEKDLSATVYYEHLLQMLSGIEEQNKWIYLNLINDIGWCYKRGGDRNKALAYFQKGVSEFGLVDKRSIQKLGHYALDLSVAYYDLGRYKEEEALLIDLKKKFVEYGEEDTWRYGILCHNLALAQVSLATYEEAEQNFKDAMDCRDKLGEEYRGDYAASCDNLADLYNKLGDYQRAEELYLKALAIRESEGKDPLYYPASLNNLANFYFSIGQYKKAERFYIQCLEVKTEFQAFDFDFGVTYGNLGWLYIATADYAKAEENVLRGKRIIDSIYSPGHPETLVPLSNLGRVYLHTGRIHEAIKALEQVTAEYIRQFGPDYIGAAFTQTHLGLAYQRSGDLKRADSLLLSAKNIYQKEYGKKHVQYAGGCLALAKFYLQTGNYSGAREFFDEEFSLRTALMNDLFHIASESEKQDYMQNIIGSNDWYYSLLRQTKNAADAYRVSVKSRNLLLQSAQQVKSAVFSTGDSSLLRSYEQWLKIKKQIAINSAATTVAYPIDSLHQQAERIEKQIARGIGRSFDSEKQSGWKEVQLKLAKKEAAIEFIEYNINGSAHPDSSFYMAVLIREGDKEPVLVDLFSAKELRKLLDETGNQVTNDGVKQMYSYRGAESERKSFTQTGNLYDIVWKPFLPYLNDVSTIYFAPAGMLHRVAFAAIRMPDSTLLSDRYRLIQLNTTASLKKEGQDSLSAHDNLVLMGGMKYGSDSTIGQLTKPETTNAQANRGSRSEHQNKWLDLPGTGREVHNIAAVAKDHRMSYDLVTGDSATEGAAKYFEGTHSPSIFHIATHGYFKSENFSGSLKQPDTAASHSTDPLFYSGLVFSGGNQPSVEYTRNGEDGILLAYEVANMYLPNTRLVVLSACETALGAIKGSEGVYGLQRAFSVAGAKNMLISLWKVPDDETVEFMEVFYTSLFENRSISKAFYEAQQKMKNKYRHEPEKWAAWILVR